MPKKSDYVSAMAKERTATILELEADRLPRSQRSNIKYLKASAKIMRDAAKAQMKAANRHPKEDFNQVAFRAVQETMRRSES